MARIAKDVSVGEYNPETGLTHITCQRGRLLFNMGSSVKKQQRRELPSTVATKTVPPPTSTGAYTGLSLYPEEANYLVQRGALIVYLIGHKATELNVAAFTSMLFKDSRVSLPCMEVYTYLKDQKLHPRRCLEPLTATASSTGDGRSVPRCSKEGEHCDVAFDVWKTMTVDVDPPEGASTASSASVNPKKQKPRKKLVLMFRVAVFRFEDAAPNPRSFRRILETSKSRDYVADCSSNGHIPVKVAGVHHDQSVLLFEISSNPAVPKQLQPGQAIEDGDESH